MPEINDVQIGETIAVEWGNAIRDRTIQRYDDDSTLASEHPNPTAGDLAYLKDSGDVLVYHSGTWRPFLPTGAVIPFAGSSAPTGWLFCRGQEVSRTTYDRLFDIIGTTYGAGDGSTTFNLPNLVQRFPLGRANSGDRSTLGAAGGEINHRHGFVHTHQVNPPATFTTTDGAHNHGGQTGNGVYHSGQNRWQPFEGPDVHHHNISSDGNHRHSVDVPAFTSGESSRTMTDFVESFPPYLVLNYLIKT